MAVRELDLAIPADRVTVIVGCSGSGKTLLLRRIDRMVRPTSSRVALDGDDIAAQDPVRLRRRIGYVMRYAGLLPYALSRPFDDRLGRLGASALTRSAESGIARR